MNRGNVLKNWMYMAKYSVAFFHLQSGRKVGKIEGRWRTKSMRIGSPRNGRMMVISQFCILPPLAPLLNIARSSCKLHSSLAQLQTLTNSCLKWGRTENTFRLFIENWVQLGAHLCYTRFWQSIADWCLFQTEIFPSISYWFLTFEEKILQEFHPCHLSAFLNFFRYSFWMGPATMIIGQQIHP